MQIYTDGSNNGKAATGMCRYRYKIESGCVSLHYEARDNLAGTLVTEALTPLKDGKSSSRLALIVEMLTVLN